MAVSLRQGLVEAARRWALVRRHATDKAVRGPGAGRGRFAENKIQGKYELLNFDILLGSVEFCLRALCDIPCEERLSYMSNRRQCEPPSLLKTAR